MNEDIQKLAEEVQAALPKAESKITEEKDVSEEAVSKTETIAEESSYTETELKAIEQGWNPEYQGDNKVDAKEYLARGSFFKKIADLKKEVNEQKQVFKHVTEHMQKMEQAAYEKARRDLLAERDEAIDTGDRTAVHLVEEKIRLEDEKYERNKINEVKQEPEKPPEVQDFLERNKSWCNEDTDENKQMVAHVNQIAAFVGQGNEKMVAELVGIKLPTGRALTVQEKLNLVEATIKKSYPHRFENQNRDKPAMVGKGRTIISNDNSQSTGLSKNLSAMQREIGEGLVRARVCKNLDEYAKQLDSYGALQK